MVRRTSEQAFLHPDVAVGDQLSAGRADDVDPGLFDVMSVWTLLIPAALFFFGAGMLFPLATSGAMEPFPFLAGTAGALVGGLQNIGSGALAAFGYDAADRAGEFRLADDPDGAADFAVLAAAGVACLASRTAGLTA